MTTTTDFYIKRTYGDFFGKVSHVDFIGPYGEHQRVRRCHAARSR